MIVRIRYLSVAATLAICSSAIAQKTVERQEYWIDGDVAGSTTIAPGAQIDLTGQNVGPHTLTIRICDNEGLWSAPVTRYFVKGSTPSAPATAIAQCEYWIDGKADERQTISDGAFIPMDDLLVGPHTITVRAKVTGSTKESIHVEICSKCHPFYTGQQKATQARGRIDKFNKKYGIESK